MLTPIADTLDLALAYARAACRVRELEEALFEVPTFGPITGIAIYPKRLLEEAAQARADLTSAYRALDRRIPADGFDLGAGARIVRA